MEDTDRSTLVGAGGRDLSMPGVHPAHLGFLPSYVLPNGVESVDRKYKRQKRRRRGGEGGEMGMGMGMGMGGGRITILFNRVLPEKERERAKVGVCP